MTELGLIALRGFCLVFLVATNTVQVSHEHYGGALVVGFLISWLWWANAHKPNVRGAAVAYGLGAAVGTVSGMAFSYQLLRWGL